MKIDKSDIETLDFIIDNILESNSQIYDGILKKIDKFKDCKPSELRLESDRIVSILEFYNCAKIKRSISGNSIEKNAHTKKFKEHGGFAKIYQDELNRLEKEEERENLSMIKLKWDTKLSKWQVKTFWPVFVFGLIGFIFGVFNFVDNLNKTKSIEELQQDNRNIQEEVSRLHTLVLDPKTVDSLHNSKTQIDSLRP